MPRVCQLRLSGRWQGRRHWCKLFIHSFIHPFIHLLFPCTYKFSDVVCFGEHHMDLHMYMHILTNRLIWWIKKERKNKKKSMNTILNFILKIHFPLNLKTFFIRIESETWRNNKKTWKTIWEERWLGSIYKKLASPPGGVWSLFMKRNVWPISMNDKQVWAGRGMKKSWRMTSRTCYNNVTYHYIPFWREI